MKLIALTPSYLGLEKAHPQHRDAACHLGWTFHNTAEFQSRGITSFEHRYLNGCSMLAMGRSLMVASALALGADLIFWVDDDIAFRTQDVLTAIDSRLPIVGFPCFHKPEPDGSVNFRLNYDVAVGETFVDKEKEFRSVVMIGTGAMLVRAEVYYAMQKRRPKFRNFHFEAFMREQGIETGPYTYDYFPMGVRDMHGQLVYCGEDVGFCVEADAAGYPPFLHGSSVTIHCREGRGSLCDYAAIRRDITFSKQVSPGELAVQPVVVQPFQAPQIIG